MQTLIIILIFLLIIIFAYQSYIIHVNSINENKGILQTDNNNNINNNTPHIVIDPELYKYNIVKSYDIQTLTDPLVAPTSRPPTYAIAPMLNNPSFYYNTRGMPDEYSYVGNLVESKILDNTNGEEITDTGLLQLMGRQKYSGSSKYEYYVLIPQKSNNTIKVSIKTPKNEEIYDGDEIKIPELGHKKYKFVKNKSVFREYF